MVDTFNDFEEVEDFLRVITDIRCVSVYEIVAEPCSYSGEEEVDLGTPVLRELPKTQ